MHPYKLIYYIYSTAHALGTCTEHVTSSEDTRDVTQFDLLYKLSKSDLLGSSPYSLVACPWFIKASSQT